MDLAVRSAHTDTRDTRAGRQVNFTRFMALVDMSSPERGWHVLRSKSNLVTPHVVHRHMKRTAYCAIDHHVSVTSLDRGRKSTATR